MRMLYDFLVIRQLVPVNPTASVRGPKYVVKRGKTPVWSREDTKRLFEKSWQLPSECVGCAPNFGDRNDDIRNGFDGGTMGVGGFDNPSRETWGSSPKH